MTSTAVPIIPVRALRATFHEVLLRHGATRHGKQYRLPVERPEQSDGYVSVTLQPNGFGRHSCLIEIDRWHASDAPAKAKEWLTENLYPFTRRVVSRKRGNYGLTLPGISDYTSAVILREEIEAFFDLWIPKEKEWQRLPMRQRRWLSV